MTDDQKRSKFELWYGMPIDDDMDISTEIKREAYEERAAILEFDAGMSRDEAEKEAMRMLGIVPEDLIEFEAGQ